MAARTPRKNGNPTPTKHDCEVWLDDEFKSEITSALLKPADQRTNIDTHDLVVSSQSGESSRKDRPSPENTASLILWTSGTTSEPRAVLLSAAGQFANATAKLNAVPQFESEIRLTVLPLSHAYARTCDFGTWLLSGCTLAVCLAKAYHERVKPNLIEAVPSMARMLRVNHIIRTSTTTRLRWCSACVC